MSGQAFLVRCPTWPWDPIIETKRPAFQILQVAFDLKSFQSEGVSARGRCAGSRATSFRLGLQLDKSRAGLVTAQAPERPCYLPLP